MPDRSGDSAIEITRVGPGDHDLARRAVRGLKAADDSGPEYLQRFLTRPEHIMLVACDDGMPVGFLLADVLDRIDGDRKMMLLYEICVAATDRREGCGRAMLEALKDICRADDVLKMWVLTNRSNTAAMRLYEATGGVSSSADDALFVYTRDRL